MSSTNYGNTYNTVIDLPVRIEVCREFLRHPWIVFSLLGHFSLTQVVTDKEWDGVLVLQEGGEESTTVKVRGPTEEWDRVIYTFDFKRGKGKITFQLMRKSKGSSLNIQMELEQKGGRRASRPTLSPEDLIDNHFKPRLLSVISAMRAIPPRTIYDEITILDEVVEPDILIERFKTCLREIRNGLIKIEWMSGSMVAVIRNGRLTVNSVLRRNGERGKDTDRSKVNIFTEILGITSDTRIRCYSVDEERIINTTLSQE